MMNFSEIIVYIWLIPVAIQILLPLGVFVAWLILKPITQTFRKQKAAAPNTVSLQEN